MYHKEVVSTKHYYVETNPIGFDMNTDLPVTFRTWGANNVFDPDVSGTGHQPTGYDIYAGAWTHYIVTAIDYKIIFNNLYISQVQDTDSSQIFGFVNFTVTDSISSVSDTWQEVMETKFMAKVSGRNSNVANFKTKKLPMPRYNGAQVTDGVDAENSAIPGRAVIAGTFKTNSYGIDHLTPDALPKTMTHWMGLTGASPTNKLFMQVGLWNRDHSFDSDSKGDNLITYSMELVYHTTWFEPHLNEINQ